jgi:kinesin family protein 3/17
MKDQLESEFAAQQRTQEESEKLRQKIEKMEKSVLVGGVNLVDVAKQQEEEIRARESEMRRQREEQKALAEKRRLEEEQILLAEKKYGSMKEEFSTKVHKIKQIRQLIKKMEDSIDDMQQQFEREKAEQTTQIRSLNRELELLRMITEKFVPVDQIEVIERHAHYDDVNRRYLIDGMELAGCHRIVEEEPAVETVFISGIKEAIFGVNKKAVDADEGKRREEAKRKKKLMVDRMLNQFALADGLGTNRK